MKKEKPLSTLTVHQWWDSYFWDIKHIDIVRKILGCDSCNSREWKKMQEYLCKEKQFELYALTTFRYSRKRNTSKQTQVRTEKLIESQYREFTKWFDEKDWEVIQNRKPVFDVLRLSYLAYSVGYNELGLMLASNFETKELIELYNVLKKINVKTDLMFRSWQYSFYKKQKNLRLKKRLMKKMKLNEYRYIRDNSDKDYTVFSAVHTANY